MKLGIISDTHDHLDHIRKAAEEFRKQEVDLVIHAGDYTSPPAVKALEGLKTAGVFGNNDGEKKGDGGNFLYSLRPLFHYVVIFSLLVQTFNFQLAAYPDINIS